MTPGTILDERVDARVGPEVDSFHDLGVERQQVARLSISRLTVDALAHRREIRPGLRRQGAGRVTREVVEVDCRRIEGFAVFRLTRPRNRAWAFSSSQVHLSYGLFADGLDQSV